MSLREAQNQHYRDNRDAWRLAMDFYSLTNLTRYLRRGKFEADGPWQSRKKDSFTFQFTRQVIHNFADQLLLRRDDVERELGPIPAGYPPSAGAADESHDLMMHQVGVYLLLFGECWLQVVPQSATLRVLSPLTVPRWTGGKVLTTGTRSTETSIFEAEQTETTYTVHTPRGYTTYAFRKNESAEKKRVQIDAGTYAPTEEDAFFVTAGGDPTPPLVRIQLPFDLKFGSLVAEVHRAMYQEESQMRSRLRSANTAGMWTTTGLNAEGEEKVNHGFKKGSNLYHLPEGAELNPIEFPTTPVEMTKEHLESMEERLYKTASMAAQQADAHSSATETVVRGKGDSAVVATLASTVESAEESALRLLAQSYDLLSYGGPRPDDPAVTADWTSIDWSESRVDLGQDAA